MAQLLHVLLQISVPNTIMGDSSLVCLFLQNASSLGPETMAFVILCTPDAQYHARQVTD